MGEEKTFIEKTQPKHILEISKDFKDLLKMLLDSYRFPLETALTVYYSKSKPASMETIDWFEMTNPKEEERLNSLFCSEYRQSPPRCEKKCKIYDQSVTLKYYRGEWQGPKLFRCHLRLWEMTYPLFVWGRLVAVLYGGQIVVTEPVKNWRDALKEIALEVVWQPTDNMMDQIGCICHKIDINQHIHQSNKDNLKKLFKETMELDEKAWKELLGKATEREPLEKKMPENRDQVEDICMALGNKGLCSEDINILKELLNKSVENEIPSVNQNQENQKCEVISAIETPEESKDIGDKKKEQLKTILNDNKQKKVEASQLLERYDKFKKFGETLEGVIEQLFSAQAEAARHEHKLSSSRMLAEAEDRLTEEKEEFWKTLDEVVKSTLPGIKGYVLYTIDQYGEGFEPRRTGIYEKQLLPEKNEADFRNFCKQVFEESHENARKNGFIQYDLTSKTTPLKYRDLLTRAIAGWEQIVGRTNVIVFLLMEGRGKITGGLICLCASKENIPRRESDLAEKFLKFYTETLKDVVDVLSMVLAKHVVLEAQVDAWAVRAHELIAPINAVKGYQDNLTCLFHDCVVDKLANDVDVKNMFVAQLARVGMLCDLLENIAKGGSFEGAEYYIKVSFEKDILLPIVQPLRDYGKREKEVDVWYDENIPNLTKLWLFTDGMKRCIFNLIFNAIKYSRPKTEVAIELQPTQPTVDSYEIHVTNKGIGVPKGEEERIFKMFTQGSNADQAAAYGAGLGLAVAREMARKHKGDVKLVSGDPERTVFALILPKSLEFGPQHKSF